MTAPARPSSRWDDRTCGVKTCRCHHDRNRPWNPADPDDRPCDRGMRPARVGQTTPGVHGTGYHQRGATPGDGAVAHCPTCKAAREAAARQTRGART